MFEIIFNTESSVSLLFPFSTAAIADFWRPEYIVPEYTACNIQYVTVAAVESRYYKRLTDFTQCSRYVVKLNPMTSG
jgi:hypothetical protein